MEGASVSKEQARELARVFATSGADVDASRLLDALRALKGELVAEVFISDVEDVYHAGGLIEITIKGVVISGRSARAIVKSSKRGRLGIVCDKS